MNLLPSSNLPHFNILSLGQRGVGKTVFLAGSYAELNQATPSKNQKKLWFECKEEESQKNLDLVLNYVRKKGKYPPPTLKITNFNFSLKQLVRNKAKTLCHFRWSDIPGEYCNFRHPEFQKMVLASHSCCVFINGERLVKDPLYTRELKTLVKQVIAIARLVKRNGGNYGFALIFTQCDRLGLGPMSQLQIEENLQFLISALETAEVKYQRFYSGIPIISDGKGYQLNVQGSASAFLWIFSELYKDTKFSRQIPSLENSLKANISTPKSDLLASSNKLFHKVGIAAGLLGLISVVLLVINRFSPDHNLNHVTTQYIQQLEQIVEQNPNDINSASILVDQYLQQGDIEKAINVLKTIVQKQPDNLHGQIKLANLYEIQGEYREAEAIYEQILATDPNNYKALWSQAVIRNQQGDKTKARILLQKAEQNAPTQEIKAKIKETAKQLNL